MLPDLPEVKRQLRRLLDQRMRRSFYRQAGIIAAARHFQSHEGDTFTVHRLDGSVETRSYKEKVVEFTVDKQDLTTFDPWKLVAKLDSAAEEMAEKASKEMFEMLNEAISKAGNVVRGGGRPISYEALLEGFEKMDLDFDQQGKPTGLSLVVHPDLGERLKTLIPQWETDPEFRRKYDALMEKKREEWRVRESRRKLVD